MNRDLWQHILEELESTINVAQQLIPMEQATLSDYHQTHGETYAIPIARLSLENVAQHNRNMRDTRRLHHMPGTAFEQRWLNYIHRGPLSEYEHN